MEKYNMRFSDLLIDLNDLYGRLVPGIVLLIDLYLILSYIESLYSYYIP